MAVILLDPTMTMIHGSHLARPNYDYVAWLSFLMPPNVPPVSDATSGPSLLIEMSESSESLAGAPPTATRLLQSMGPTPEQRSVALRHSTRFVKDAMYVR